MFVSLPVVSHVSPLLYVFIYRVACVIPALSRLALFAIVFIKRKRSFLHCLEKLLVLLAYNSINYMHLVSKRHLANCLSSAGDVTTLCDDAP